MVNNLKNTLPVSWVGWPGGYLFLGSQPHSIGSHQIIMWLEIWY
jgi:hypothetical protein